MEITRLNKSVTPSKQKLSDAKSSESLLKS